MRNNKTGIVVLNTILDSGPYIIIGVSFLIGIASIIALLGVDIYTGKVIGFHMSRENLFGWLISLATTGLIVVAVGLFVQGWKLEWNIFAMASLGLVVFSLLCIDAWFDGMSVDVKRFGEFVDVKTLLSPTEAFAHNLFRILVAGVSLVGEPLATMSVLFFPAMKTFLGTLFSEKAIDTTPARPNVPTPSRTNYPVPKSAPSSSTFGGYSPRIPDRLPTIPVDYNRKQPTLENE